MNYMKYFFLIICSFFLISSCSDYTSYIPVELIVINGDHKFIEKPELLTKDHIIAIKVILKKYDEEFKISEGKLLIKKSLSKDKNLLQNYTFKAEVYRLGT